MDLVGIINIINIHYINDIYKKTIINKFKTFLMDYTYRFNIFIINFINLCFNINYGDWGLGIGDWGLGIGLNA